MHLRFVTRVNVIAALAVGSLLFYSACIYPSLHVRTRLTKAWTGTSRKVVIFGDSFSDTGTLLDITSKTQGLSSGEPQGTKWVEVLCHEVRSVLGTEISTC
jgi:hypothetical protein